MGSQFNFSETEKLIPACAIYINMKSHLFQLLLLFLLLVDTTPAKIPPSVIKGLHKVASIVYKKIKKPNTWNKVVDNAANQFSPSQPADTQIPGLSQIKEYFYNFGYLNKTGQFNDYLDNDIVSAIKTYQQYFNLPVTGDLNNETSQQITLPRCGVPDMSFSYGFYEGSNASWPKGNQWFPKGRKNLTYGFLPPSEIPDNMTKVFRDAFTRWSQTTRVMNFTETTTYDDANIKIGFYDFDERVEDTVVGGSIIRLQQFYEDSNVSYAGEVRLDATKYWVLPSANFSWSWEYGDFDLETAAMHQIGHLLGLDHSSEQDSVMYPTILPKQQRKVEITVSDNQTIHQLYASAINANSGYGGCFALFGSSSGLLTILSLGFAFMALSE